MSRREALISGSGSADGSSMERTSRNGYQNIVLSCIAGLLVLGMVDRRGSDGVSGVMGPSAAMAGEPEGSLMNALEQRKQIIAELRILNSRMERIEAKLTSGLSVKVTDMPKGQDAKPRADKPEKPEGKPEAKVEVKSGPDGR